jgi:hypothetical protein
MRIFLAGIMQGSHVSAQLHSQEYRAHLKWLLGEHLPEAEVYDPQADHTNSLEYDDALGRQVFFHHNQLCREVDVVLAFVPLASMGTAIEMWEAHQAGKVVVAISPLAHNWAGRFLSHILYTDLAEFEAELTSGRLLQRLGEVRASWRQPVRG